VVCVTIPSHGNTVVVIVFEFLVEETHATRAVVGPSPSREGVDESDAVLLVALPDEDDSENEKEEADSSGCGACNDGGARGGRGIGIGSRKRGGERRGCRYQMTIRRGNDSGE